MISLLVNDQEVELLERQNISLRKQVYDLLKKEEVTKSYSTNIKIPLTGKNVKIFEGLFSPLQQTQTIAYKKIPARLLIDNIFIGEIGSYLIVQSLTEKYLNVVYYERQVMSYISQIPDDTLANIIPQTTWTTINNNILNTTPFTNTNSNTTGVKFFYQRARNNNIEEIIPLLHTNWILVVFANIDISKYFHLIRPFVLSTLSRYVAPTKFTARPKLSELTYANKSNFTNTILIRWIDVRQFNHPSFTNTLNIITFTYAKTKNNSIAVLKITTNTFDRIKSFDGTIILKTYILINGQEFDTTKDIYFLDYNYESSSIIFTVEIKTEIIEFKIEKSTVNANIDYDIDIETSEIDMDFDAKYMFGDINLRTLVKDLLTVENSTMILENGEYKLTPFTDILKVATTQLEDVKVVKTIFKSSNLGKKMYLDFKDGYQIEIHSITGNEIIEDEKTLATLAFDGTKEDKLFDIDGKYRNKYYYVLSQRQNLQSQPISINYNGTTLFKNITFENNVDLTIVNSGINFKSNLFQEFQMITVEVQMSLLEYNNLDLLKTVYIKELAGIFWINRVVRFQPNKPTQLELIRIKI